MKVGVLVFYMSNELSNLSFVDSTEDGDLLAEIRV